MADWTDAALEELGEPSRTGALRADKKRHREALWKWRRWRKFLRRHGIRVPMFMRPWDAPEPQGKRDD